ncbi:TPA: hypothetical protein ACS1FU_001941 [Klebsiella aerogenes]
MNNELTAALLTIEKCRELSGCPAGVDLQDWVKQLAAENVALKSFGETLQEIKSSLVGGGHGYMAKADMQAQGAVLDVVLDAFDDIETPATDRIYAEAEARGVEKFAEWKNGVAEAYREVSPGCAGESEARYAEREAMYFAQQLREVAK